MLRPFLNVTAHQLSIEVSTSEIEPTIVDLDTFILFAANRSQSSDTSKRFHHNAKPPIHPEPRDFVSEVASMLILEPTPNFGQLTHAAIQARVPLTIHELARLFVLGATTLPKVQAITAVRDARNVNLAEAIDMMLTRAEDKGLI